MLVEKVLAMGEQWKSCFAVFCARVVVWKTNGHIISEFCFWCWTVCPVGYPFGTKTGDQEIRLYCLRYTVNKNQANRKNKQPGQHCSSNQNLRVWQDTGSDQDLMFHRKGTIMHIFYLTRQVPISWHTWNGSFLTKRRTEVTLRFFNYSNSKEYTISLDLV